MSTYKYSIGNIYENKNNDKFEVIENISSNRRKIKFLDAYGYEKIIDISQINRGNIKNPYYKNIYGVGVSGIRYKKNRTIYNKWLNILTRCYNVNFYEKNKSYSNCKVSDEWLLFDNFLDWFNITFPFELSKNIKFEIDKDLLQNNSENKVYSKETCIWLPKSVNVFLSSLKKVKGYFIKGNRFIVECTDFETGKHYHVKTFKLNEEKEALNCYLFEKNKQIDKVKEFLKSLKYIDNSIIEKIKCDIYV